MLKNIQKISLLLLLTALSFSNVQAGDFLPPEQAFQFKAQQTQDTIDITWRIEPGYYLYKNRISAFYAEQANVQDVDIIFVSKSIIKDDKNFGKVPVFFNEAKVRIAKAGINAEMLTIEYQGCAKKGLCYQPQLKQITLLTTSALNTQTETEVAENVDLSTLNSDANSISSLLKNASFLSTVGIFLLLGIGLSLTPCILPMVPILSGIIVGQGDKLSAKHGAILSSSYVLGMSSAYALAGIAAATFGAKGNLQLYMQNPWVISIFSLVFVALALSMFGFYTLQLPSSVQNKLYNYSNQQKGGKLSGVFIMGALSALVVSPCVSAPLAGALVFISSTGDKLIGGSALFALGIGMGLPLIAIGIGGGKLVPKAGAWMNQVKNFFGVILLGVAIWLLSRILPASFILLLWALLFITYAIHSGALEVAEAGFNRNKKALSFILLIYGCVLFVGALMGATNPLQPIPLLQTSVAMQANTAATENAIFTPITSSEELDAAIEKAAQQGKPVLVDFYADWCTSCIEMEKNVFKQADVQQLLHNYVLLQIDVTNATASKQQLLDRFGIFGPPSILLFTSDGIENKERRIQGELDHEAFIAHIAQSNKL